MGKKKRIFSVDFKKQVVREVETGACGLAEAARRYELSPSLIQIWRDKARDGALIDRPSTREKALEKENRALKEQVGELYMRVDALKKTAGYARRLKSASSSVITGLNWEQSRKDVK